MNHICYCDGQVRVEKNELWERLQNFIEKYTPQIVLWFAALFRKQEKDLSHDAVREAIVTDDIPLNLSVTWEAQWKDCVSRHIKSSWTDVSQAAAQQTIAETLPQATATRFDPMADNILQWIDHHGAEFVTNCVQTQIDALRAVIHNAATCSQGIHVDQLARAIRPMTGLSRPQASANWHYYTTLIDGGTSPQRAQILSTRYAKRQRTYRSYLIARTEIAYAYNRGAYEAIRQAQTSGLLGPVVKVWRTAATERTCPLCRQLEGVSIDMEEEFSYPTRLDFAGIRRAPPAHPNCMCQVEYKIDPKQPM